MWPGSGVPPLNLLVSEDGPRFKVLAEQMSVSDARSRSGSVGTPVVSSFFLRVLIKNLRITEHPEEFLLCSLTTDNIYRIGLKKL